MYFWTGQKVRLGSKFSFVHTCYLEVWKFEVWKFEVFESGNLGVWESGSLEVLGVLGELGKNVDFLMGIEPLFIPSET